MKNCSRLYAESNAWVFSNRRIEKKAMMQFQIVLGMISDVKQQDTRVSYSKDLIIQICNFIKKRLQHRCFPKIIAKL